MDDEREGLYVQDSEQARMIAEDALDDAERAFTREAYVQARHERQRAQVFATLAVALAIKEAASCLSEPR
jgi:hypothetical protein